MDVRNTLIAAGLSYIEHLRPSYFLLENVPSTATHPLCGREADGEVTGGIEWGMHKFIMRTSLDLG